MDRDGRGKERWKQFVEKWNYEWCSFSFENVCYCYNIACTILTIIKPYNKRNTVLWKHFIMFWKKMKHRKKCEHIDTQSISVYAANIMLVLCSHIDIAVLINLSQRNTAYILLLILSPYKPYKTMEEKRYLRFLEGDLACSKQIMERMIWKRE